MLPDNTCHATVKSIVPYGHANPTNDLDDHCMDLFHDFPLVKLGGKTATVDNLYTDNHNPLSPSGNHVCPTTNTNQRIDKMDKIKTRVSCNDVLLVVQKYSTIQREDEISATNIHRANYPKSKLG